MSNQKVSSNLSITKQEKELNLLEKVWVHEATKCPKVTTSVLKKLNKT